MATDATEFPIPAPANASFVSGEKAVGVASASVGTDYFFSRNFFASASALYLFKVWSAAAATIKVGRDEATLATALVTPADGVVQTQLYLQKGVNRIDVQMEAVGDEFFALLLFHPDEIVYASDAAGWVFDTALIEDADVPGGNAPALPVFSVLPNWARGVRERVSYLTDIPTSETATEQARMLRFHPRRTFEADFMRKGANRSRVDHFLTGIARRIFLLPLWHEQYRTTAPLTPSTTFTEFPPGELALREFQPGDRVFVNAGDPTIYEVLVVLSIDHTLNRVNWIVPSVNTWPAGSRLIPMRHARVVEQMNSAGPVDDVLTATIRFELVDPDYRFGAAWGGEFPIWPFPVNRAEDIGFIYNRLVYEIDNSVGPVSYAEPAAKPLLAMRSALLLRGRSQVVAFRRFIDAAGGRAGRFYMPTEMNDLVPATASISGLQIDAVPSGFTEYFDSLPACRLLLAIYPIGDAPVQYAQIGGVQKVGEVERFFLRMPIPEIQMSTVRRIGFIVPSRFDQDTFELEHLVDQSAAIRTSVVTRSVDYDEIPPLVDLFVEHTTAPEELANSISFEGGELFEVVDGSEDGDAMNSSLTITGGTLA